MIKKNYQNQNRGKSSKNIGDRLEDTEETDKEDRKINSKKDT